MDQAGRTRRDLIAAILAGLLSPPFAARAAVTALRIGIAPHTSPRGVIDLYAPLRESLESRLGQPVEIQTAPDFTSFIRRAIGQDYDIAITTGHQARLLQQDAGYLPLVTYSTEFRAVVVVLDGAGIVGPGDLAGKTVMGLSPTSLVTQWGRRWLARHSVANVQTRYLSAADSVARILLVGEIAAAFMSSANIASLPADLRPKLRILARSDPMLGRVYLLNGALQPRRGKILDALDRFATSTAGRLYFDTTGLGGYRPVTQAELMALDTYADEVRTILAATRSP